MEHKGLYTGLGIMALIVALGLKREAKATEPVLVKKMETTSKPDIEDILPEPIPPIPIRPVQKEIVPPERPIDQTISEALEPFLALEAVQIDPISLTPVDTELVKLPEQISDIQTATINAEYQIPLYNLANRDIVYDYYQQMISMGASLKDISKIDLSAIPSATWTKMGFDIAFSTICAFAGPVGWIMGGVKALFNFLTGKSPEEKRAEEEAAVKEAVDAFKDFYKQHKIGTKPCMLLGTLAKHRVGSHLVPLVKIYNPQFGDETYVTGGLLPIFLESGYTTNGKALGYISTLPFPHSILIKIMFSFELMDFVLVADGSEFERALTNANYFPITELGYVSRVIQPGQQGEISVDYGNLEIVRGLDQKGIRFLLGHINPNVSFNRYLKGNVALPGIIDENVLAKAGLPMKVLDPRDYASKGRFPVMRRSPARPVDIIADTNPRTGRLAKNSGVITTDVLTEYRTAKNNLLYGVFNRLPIPQVYHGLTVPPIGSSTGLIGNKLLLHQINGALVEIHLPAAMAVKDKLLIISLVGVLALAVRPKYALRKVLGPFFKNIKGYPIYTITSLDAIKRTLSQYNAGHSLWRAI